MFCSASHSHSSSLFLVFHTDTHHTRPPIPWNRRSRSTTSCQCSTNQQSNNNSSSLSPPHHFIIHTLFTQTLTILNLAINEIGDQGAQHLANGLQINKVTTTLLLFLLLITSSFTHFSHRHSPHYSLDPIKSAIKEQNILPMLYKSTK